jgi:hypothetical protein
MVHTVLQVLTTELNTFLEQQLEPVEVPVVVLSELMSLDGSVALTSENKVICTLLNIEQERTNLNAPMGHKGVHSYPPFNLNLYLLFSAFYAPKNYLEALRAITATIGFFQGKPVFTASNTSTLPNNLSKVAVEIVNIDLKELSNLWSTLGAKHLPSILFKARMISITSEMILEEFTRIQTLDPKAKT